MESIATKLIFVYNADSGIWNGFMDMMHKTFNPSTYSCQLCSVLYGTFGMRKKWDTFTKNLPCQIIYFHRDEWVNKYQIKDPLPAVFLEKEGKISVFLESEKLKTMSIDELMEFIDNKLKASLREG